MNITFPVIFCSLLSIVIVFGCDETLPEYHAPTDILIGSFIPWNAPEDSVRYFMIDENNPNLITVTLNSPPYAYDIHIINTYEESIQDEADIQGTVTLSWSAKPDLQARIPLSVSSVYNGSYDPVTNMITIDPGDTLTLRAYWSFKFSNNEWAFGNLQYVDGAQFVVFPKVTDNYRYHEPMRMHASAHVKIFKTLSYVDVVSKEDFHINFLGRIRHPE